MGMVLFKDSPTRNFLSKELDPEHKAKLAFLWGCCSLKALLFISQRIEKSGPLPKCTGIVRDLVLQVDLKILEDLEGLPTWRPSAVYHNFHIGLSWEHLFKKNCEHTIFVFLRR